MRLSGRSKRKGYKLASNSMSEEKRGSPVSTAGTGFIKVLSSPQALTAKVMTGEFRRAVAEGKTIIHQTLPSLSHSRRWPRNTAAWREGSPLFNLDV